MLQVYKIYFLSKFIWLIFIRPTFVNVQFLAPYNCQFLIVRQITKSTYQLFELYSIRSKGTVIYDKRFLINYGTWDSYEGLNVSSELFYYRRPNMNQTVFTVFYLPDCDVSYNTKQMNKIIVLKIVK